MVVVTKKIRDDVIVQIKLAIVFLWSWTRSRSNMQQLCCNAMIECHWVQGWIQIQLRYDFVFILSNAGSGHTYAVLRLSSPLLSYVFTSTYLGLGSWLALRGHHACQLIRKWDWTSCCWYMVDGCDLLNLYINFVQNATLYRLYSLQWSITCIV